MGGAGASMAREVLGRLDARASAEEGQAGVCLIISLHIVCVCVCVCVCVQGLYPTGDLTDHHIRRQRSECWAVLPATSAVHEAEL